jgi:hypothetical protein
MHDLDALDVDVDLPAAVVTPLRLAVETDDGREPPRARRRGLVLAQHDDLVLVGAGNRTRVHQRRDYVLLEELLGRPRNGPLRAVLARPSRLGDAGGTVVRVGPGTRT